MTKLTNSIYGTKISIAKDYSPLYDLFKTTVKKTFYGTCIFISASFKQINLVEGYEGFVKTIKNAIIHSQNKIEKAYKRIIEDNTREMKAEINSVKDEINTVKDEMKTANDKVAA